MKKALIAAMVAALAITAPVFAEDDRIAQLEQQVADLTARVEALEENGTVNDSEAPSDSDNTQAEEKTEAADKITDDSQTTGNVGITVTGISEATEAGLNGPEEGNVYLMVSLDFVNLGEEKEPVNVYVNHDDSYVDGYSVKIDDWASDLSAEILPGKHASGIVAYEVPADWSEFEFYWRQGYDTPEDDVAVFTFTRADLS